MSDEPVGDHAYLFTDIEGSTQLLRRLGERYTAVLLDHYAILRGAIASAGGTVVGTEGDSFFAIFSRAADAVHAAVDAQRGLVDHAWPEDATVRVRMGVHFGPAEYEQGQWVGLEIHRAARIAATAHGGQIIASDRARAALGDSIPGASMRDLGLHRLRDFDEPVRIWQVDVDGLPTEHPPLRSLSGRYEVLPTLLSEFLGRAPELAAISGLVLEHRLMTLTGPGGSGKTRLAIEVGRAVLDDLADGVAFVPLAAITDPALVANAIRTALALQENPMRPTLDTLVDALRAKEMLLILDNLEHLLEAGGAIRDLIGRTERLHVLVTSRARLQLAGEREFPVPPLDLPPLKLQGTDPLGYAAIALFVDRARAARPDFELNPENTEAIVALCRRLDGLPLAIELAAARVRLLSPDAILERLGQSLDFLSSRDRDRPDRQRTLVNAIAWSFDLLDEPEQRLLRRLGVFVGGWTLSDATAITADPGESDDDVLDRLAQLVDQSLVVAVESGGDPRFTMLETIREFARDRLEEAGELDALSERHGVRFGQRILDAEPHLTGSDRSWLDGLENDHDNIRAMLTWATRNRAELAMRCGGALWRFWHLRGHLREGRKRLTDILASAEANPAWLAERAKALDGLGGIAYWQGDFDVAQSAYQEALAILRELDDTRGVAGQLYNLGYLVAITGDYVTSAQMYQASLDLYESLGDLKGAAGAAFAVAFAPQLMGDAATATRMLGDVLRRVRSLGDVYLTINVVLALSRSNVSLGHLDEANGYIREGMALAAELGDVGLTAFALWDAAALLGQLGQHGPAARLAGTVQAFREAAGGQAPDVLIKVVDPVPAARAALGDEVVEAELAAGRLLGRDDAVRLASDLLSSSRQALRPALPG